MIGAVIAVSGNACGSELAHGFKTAMRRGAARLHRAGEAAVERGEGDRDGDEALLRHRRQQIDVTQDQRRLGDQHHGVIELDSTSRISRVMRNSSDGLVDVGIAGELDAAHLVGFFDSSRRSRAGPEGFTKIFVSKSRPGERPR